MNADPKSLAGHLGIFGGREDHVPDELSEFACQAACEFQTSQKATKVMRRSHPGAARAQVM